MDWLWALARAGRLPVCPWFRCVSVCPCARGLLVCPFARVPVDSSCARVPVDRPRARVPVCPEGREETYLQCFTFRWVQQLVHKGWYMDISMSVIYALSILVSHMGMVVLINNGALRDTHQWSSLALDGLNIPATLGWFYNVCRVDNGAYAVCSKHTYTTNVARPRTNHPCEGHCTTSHPKTLYCNTL